MRFKLVILDFLTNSSPLLCFARSIFDEVSTMDVVIEKIMVSIFLYKLRNNPYIWVRVAYEYGVQCEC